MGVMDKEVIITTVQDECPIHSPIRSSSAHTGHASRSLQESFPTNTRTMVSSPSRRPVPAPKVLGSVHSDPDDDTYKELVPRKVITGKRSRKVSSRQDGGRRSGNVPRSRGPSPHPDTGNVAHDVGKVPWSRTSRDSLWGVTWERGSRRGSCVLHESFVPTALSRPSGSRVPVRRDARRLQPW